MSSSLISPLVFVHIVTFNNEKTIAKTLSSVLAQETLIPWETMIVRVTDNASSDQTVSVIREQFSKEVRLVCNEDNRGFSKAHNDGFQSALSCGAKFIFVLNPDVVLAKDSLRILISVLNDDPSCGSATPKLLRADKELNPVSPPVFDAAGMVLTESFRHFDRGSQENDIGQYNDNEYVFGGTGAALLLRSAFIEDVSLVDPDDKDYPEVFDNAFFAYREDADLALRGQWLGWRCRYVPKALGYHVRVVLPEKRSKLSPLLNLYGVRNRFLLQLNNFSFKAHFPFLLSICLRNILVIGAALTIEYRSAKALYQALSLSKRALLNRKRLMARKRVSPLTIRKLICKDGVQGKRFPALTVSKRKETPLSVVAVIINYNSGERLKRCLQSLRQIVESQKAKRVFSVVVIDNNSNDLSISNARSVISKEHGVTLIESMENLGFAGGIMKAIDGRDEDAVLILNPDIEMSEESFEALVSDFENYSQVQALAPTLISFNGEPQIGFSAKRLPTIGSTLAELFFLHQLWRNNPWTRHLKYSDDCFTEDYFLQKLQDGKTPHLPLNRPILVEQPPAACLLISLKVFRSIGGMDTAFWPAWFEDVDLCKRLLNADYQIAVTAKSRVLHEGGYSVDTISKSTFASIWYGNLRAYWLKHGSFWERLFLRAALPVALLLRSVLCFIQALVARRKNRELFQLSKTLLKLATSATLENRQPSSYGKAN